MDQTRAVLRIRTSGLKEHDHELGLGRLTLLAAPNETGKSTIPEAIRFAALGYVPILGKRPSDTAALMRGGEMSVEVELADGRVFSRSLARAPKGALSGSVECSWLRNAKPSEHHQEILRLFGAEESDAAEVLDIRELIAATPNKRAERIEALMTAGRATPKALAGLVAELTTRRLADKEDAKLEDWRSLIPTLTPEQRAALKGLAGMLEAKIIDGGIPGAAAWANDEKRRAANDYKHKVEARAEIERRIEELPESEPQKIEALAADRDRLQREMGAARERSEEAARLARAIETADEMLHDAANAVMRARAAESAMAADQGRVETIRAELTVIEARLDGLAPPAAPNLSEVEDLDRRASELRLQAGTIKIPTAEAAEEEASRIAQKCERLEAEIERVAQSPWAPIVALAHEIDASPEIPAEAAVRSKIRRLVALAGEGLGTSPEDLEAQLSQAKAALVQALEQAATAGESRRVQEAARDELLGGSTRLYAEADELRRKLLAEHKAASTATEECRTTLLAARDKARRESAEIRARFSLIGVNLAKAESAHKAAVARREALGATSAADSPIAFDRIKLQDELDRIGRELEALTAAAATRQELSRLVTEIEVLGVEREVFAAVEWAVQRARERAITEGDGPLAQTMSRFFAAAGRPERPYFRAGRGAVEIGWTKPGVGDVPIQTLSGAGYVLFAAALTSAVLIARAAPVRILMIEAGEADAATLAQIMAGISALKEELTAAIVNTHLRPVEIAEGWRLERLEPQSQKMGRHAEA